MRRNWPLIALLLIAIIAVNAVAVCSSTTGYWPDAAVQAVLALAFCQTGIAAAGAAILPGSNVTRIAGLLTVVALWSVALTEPQRTVFLDWAVLLGLQAMLVVLPMLVARVVGFQLTYGMPPQDRSSDSAPPLRFSLMHVLMLVTCIGMLCGSLRWTADRYVGERADLISLYSVATIAVLMSSAILARGWASFFVMFNVLIGCNLAGAFASETQTTLLIVSALSCAFISAVLLTAGCRISRQGRHNFGEPFSVPDAPTRRALMRT